jgi:hypothetical protein
MTVVGNYFDVNSPCDEPHTVYAFSVTPVGVSTAVGAAPGRSPRRRSTAAS